MAYSAQLFGQFLQRLNGAGFAVGPDQAVILQELFYRNKVNTFEELNEIRFQIGPVITRSAEDQRKFYRVVAQFIAENKVEIPAGIVSPDKEASNLTRVFFIRVVADLVLAVFFIFLLWPKDHPPPIHAAVTASDSIVTVNNTVTFYPVKDSLYPDALSSWDFGDGMRSNKLDGYPTVSHNWSKPGTYQVKLKVFSGAISDSMMKKIVVVKDTQCRLQPSVSFSGNEKPNLNKDIQFYNNTQSAGGNCYQSASWDFGDSTARVTQMAGDSAPVVHRYTEPGTYIVRLVAYSDKDSAATEASLQISNEEDFIPLLSLMPQEKKNLNAFTEMKPLAGYLVIILYALFFIGVVLFSVLRFRILRRMLNDQHAEKFPEQTDVKGPYSVKLPGDEQPILAGKMLNEIAFRFRQPEGSSVPMLDIGATIHQTIRNAGFPHIVMDTARQQPHYLVLIDLDSGVNQQVQLFEELLSMLEKFKVNMLRYYFRGSMQRCYNETDNRGVSIEKLAELYGSSRLIVYSNGYSLLNENGDDGLVGWAMPVLRRWNRRALVTPVPRNHWGDNERLINALIPVYPAGLRGHLLLASAFISGNNYEQPPDPKNNRMAIGHKNPDELRRIFHQEKDQDLLYWIFALSVPDSIDWETTLLTGRAIERCSATPSRPLITYENLLRICSAEWLQHGEMSNSLRKSFRAELLKDEKGLKIMRAVQTDLLHRLRETNPPENSAAYLDKQIKESVLRYQLSEGDERKAAVRELHYLAQKGLLNQYDREEIASDLESYTTYRVNRRLLVILGIVLVLFVPSWMLRSNLDAALGYAFPKTFAKDTVSIDSSTYWNNKAVEVMKRSMDGNAVDTINKFIRRGFKFDRRCDTLLYNYYVLMNHGLQQYYNARDLYHALDYADSVDTYATIDSMVVLKKENYRGYLHALDYYLHTLGVIKYYRRNVDLDTSAYYYNSLLKADGFYELYPDKYNNLDRLLSANPDLSHTKYNLSVNIPKGETATIVIYNSANQKIADGEAPFTTQLAADYYKVDAEFGNSKGHSYKFITLKKDLSITIKPLKGYPTPQKKYKLTIKIKTPPNTSQPVSQSKYLAVLTRKGESMGIESPTKDEFYYETEAGFYEFELTEESDMSRQSSMSFALTSDTTLYIEAPAFNGGFNGSDNGGKPNGSQSLNQTGTKADSTKNQQKIKVTDLVGRPYPGVIAMDKSGNIAGSTNSQGEVNIPYDKTSDGGGTYSLTLSGNGHSDNYIGVFVGSGNQTNSSFNKTFVFSDTRIFTFINYPKNTNGKNSRFKSATDLQIAVDSAIRPMVIDRDLFRLDANNFVSQNNVSYKIPDVQSSKVDIVVSGTSFPVAVTVKITDPEILKMFPQAGDLKFQVNSVADFEAQLKRFFSFEAAYLKQYPQGVTEIGPRSEGGAVVTQRIEINGSKVIVYTKKAYSWGGVYYFKDGQQITENAYLSLKVTNTVK